MYCEDNGRPSVPPAIMAKVLLLQRYDDVTDREAARRVKMDIGWKHALGVQVNWEGFHHSMLSHFRARLLAHNMEGIAFEKLNELAAQLGLISSDHLHAIDSSHILGAAQVKDTYELIRDAMAKVVEGLEAIGEQAGGGLLGEEKTQTYRNKQKADIDWHDQDQRHQQLQVLVEDACRLLKVADHQQLPEEGQAGEAVELLEKILRQDIQFPDGEGVGTYKRGGEDQQQTQMEGKQGKSEDEQSENEEEEEEGEVSIKQGVSPDRMMSVVDPQMRHGRKSSAHRFNGYTGHIMEDLDAEWINHVMIDEANKGDGEVGTAPLRESQVSSGYRPDELLGDMAYGTADNRVEYEEEDVDLISPVPEARNAHGKFSKDQFDMDLDAGEVTCPAGKTTTNWMWTRDSQERKVKIYTFDKDDCKECPLRSECTTARRGRTIPLNYNEKKLQEDRAYQESEEFQEKYPRRAACERKVYEVMRVHGMRQSRHMGKRRTEMQMKWTAAVVNLKRLPKLLEEKIQAVKQQVQSILQAKATGSIPEMVPI